MGDDGLGVFPVLICVARRNGFGQCSCHERDLTMMSQGDDLEQPKKAVPAAPVTIVCCWLDIHSRHLQIHELSNAWDGDR
jgi:hypothetical protein